MPIYIFILSINPTNLKQFPIRHGCHQEKKHGERRKHNREWEPSSISLVRSQIFSPLFQACIDILSTARVSLLHTTFPEELLQVMPEVSKPAHHNVNDKLTNK